MFSVAVRPHRSRLKMLIGTSNCDWQTWNLKEVWKPSRLANSAEKVNQRHWPWFRVKGRERERERLRVRFRLPSDLMSRTWSDTKADSTPAYWKAKSNCSTSDSLTVWQSDSKRVSLSVPQSDCLSLYLWVKIMNMWPQRLDFLAELRPSKSNVNSLLFTPKTSTAFPSLVLRLRFLPLFQSLPPLYRTLLYILMKNYAVKLNILFVFSVFISI